MWWRTRPGAGGAIPNRERAASAHRRGKPGGGDQRRIRLADAVGKGGARRGRLAHQRTKGVCQRDPAGDILVTQAVHDDPETGPTVLHFAIPVAIPDRAAGQLVCAGHAGHRIAGRDDQRCLRPGLRDFVAAACRKIERGLSPQPGHDPSSAGLCGVSGRCRGRLRHRTCDRAQTSCRPRASVSRRRNAQRFGRGANGAPRHGGSGRHRRTRNGDDEPGLDRPHAGRPRRHACRGKGDGGGGRAVRFTGHRRWSGCFATFRARGTIVRRSDSNCISADGWRSASIPTNSGRPAAFGHSRAFRALTPTGKMARWRWPRCARNGIIGYCSDGFAGRPVNPGARTGVCKRARCRLGAARMELR